MFWGCGSSYVWGGVCAWACGGECRHCITCVVVFVGRFKGDFEYEEVRHFLTSKHAGGPERGGVR